MGTNVILSPLASARILLVFGGLELGGAERQGFLLAKHLLQVCGADVSVVGVKGGPGRLAQLCQDEHIPWLACQIFPIRTRWQWCKAISRFAWEMKQERPDLILSYTHTANVLSAFSWRFAGASGYIWNQADEGLGMTRKIINRIAVAAAPVFVSNSIGGKKFLVNTLRVPEKKVDIIHNGLALLPPVATRMEWRMRLGIGEEVFTAVMVANITRFKDHATLIKAWRIVLDSVAMLPSPILLLAGRPDCPARGLLDLAEKLHLLENVRFLGEVTDIPGLLSAADAFVYSSVSEGLPNAVVEGMLAGLPVVGTDIPGIVEAIGPQHRNYLAPVGDAQELARRILALLASRETCCSYGLSLRERAKNEFALEKMLNQTTALCCRQIAQTRARMFSSFPRGN